MGGRLVMCGVVGGGLALVGCAGGGASGDASDEMALVGTAGEMAPVERGSIVRAGAVGAPRVGDVEVDGFEMDGDRTGGRAASGTHQEDVGGGSDSTAPGTDREPAGHGDGRPGWWFPEVRRADGRVMVCVEALAPDVRGARTAAVERAFARVARVSSGDDSGRAVVEHVLVLPLAQRAANGAAYVGYAQASAPE